MSTQFSFGLAGTLALLLLICRPWLEARRPMLGIALAAGWLVGPGGSGVVPHEWLSGLEPILALSTGWLAMLAADSWDRPTLRRTLSGRGVGFAALAALAAGAVAGGAALAAGPHAARAGAGPVALVIVAACIALALDPEAARDALGRARRTPDAAARFAPALSGLLLGCALACSGFAFGLAKGLGALLAGVGLGVVLLAVLRVVDGRGPVLVLVATTALGGCGLALRLELSAPALLFAAGATVVSDAARRDLVFTTLRELQLPLTIALLILCGASLPAFGSHAGGASAAAAVLGLLLAMMMICRPLLARAGLSLPGSVALSPLALALARLPEEPTAILTAAAAAFILAELAGRLRASA